MYDDARWLPVIRLQQLYQYMCSQLTEQVRMNILVTILVTVSQSVFLYWNDYRRLPIITHYVTQPSFAWKNNHIYIQYEQNSHF